jgi:hypothetical protein
MGMVVALGTHMVVGVVVVVVGVARSRLLAPLLSSKAK